VVGPDPMFEDSVGHPVGGHDDRPNAVALAVAAVGRSSFGPTDFLTGSGNDGHHVCGGGR